MAPVFSTDWKIGKPDVIISIPPHSLTADGPDEYEYFTVPTNFTEDKWVVAAELRPGNRKIVHHAHVFVNAPHKPKAASAKKDEPADPQSAYREWLRVHEGKLSWMRYDAPVIDDGCIVDDNSYWPGDKPRDENFGSWGLISSYLPGRGPDVYPAGNRAQDSRRLQPRLPDPLLQSHQETGNRRDVRRPDLRQRAAQAGRQARGPYRTTSSASRPAIRTWKSPSATPSNRTCT